ESSTRVDTDDLTTEQVGVVVELGDGVDVYVGGYGPADVGAFQVGAEGDQLVPVLGPVGLVGGRKPGGDDGVEVALRPAGPHRPSVDRSQVHVVTQLIHEHSGDYMGRGDLGIPKNVAEFDGFVLRQDDSAC